ncbi:MULTISPECIES: universal stress protein [Thioalkalivibrio]|uniref:UspA domain-containing protein n=1 Tax=Thioalkalivibrio halophilus TaxID=252474 RepID=A0A1V2ZZ37_9GAMM|nr:MULTISPECIES: universal stress protein [Thioalkalivibrio]OOC10349.1 hypothetical protein B1A74_06010 [Thioalkalivibrio halophilus]PYG02856.1 nucleotide-binding universal stress UspA family protein [Thioalkalivibrio sp. ALE21]
MTDPAGTQPLPSAEAGRILVLLDASHASQAALEAAATLAATLQGELQAIFVEEADLLRSAAYPFTREIGSLSGQPRPLETGLLETRLRRRAAHLRRAAEQAAARARIHCSLEVRRGSVRREVLALTTPGDFLVLGKIGWSAATGSRLGSTARSLVHEAPGRVHLTGTRPTRPDSPVLVVVDAPETAHEALVFARARARQQRRPLTVLLVPLDDPDAARERDRALSEWVATDDPPVRVRSLRSSAPRELLRTLERQPAAEVVLGRRSPLLAGPQGDALLGALEPPVTITP